MGIKVQYNNYELKEIKELMNRISNVESMDEISIETLKGFSRDMSWGTYTDELLAIKKLFPKKFKFNIREPKVDKLALAKDKEGFSLEFQDDVFDFESEGVNHFIGTIAGDVLTYSNFKSIQVDDFEFKGKEYEKFFKGPNIGVDSIYRDFFNISIDRPIVAFTVKPRMGLKITDYEKIYDKVSEGGIDLIEDDERLIDPPYCRFKDRVNVMQKIQNKKGRRTKFSVNITGTVEKMRERLVYADQKGLKFVKIDVLVTGFDALKLISDFIRKEMDSRVAITCYSDAIGIYRNLSRKFILKMSRLCGADIIYTGTPQWSRMDDESQQERYDRNIKDVDRKHSNQKLLLDGIKGFQNVKEALPTISNGCDICNAELIQFIYKSEYKHSRFAFFIGGGLSAFPADIVNATREWMRCICFTAQKEIDDYSNYDYKYRKQMEENGMMLFDIKGEMCK